MIEHYSTQVKYKEPLLLFRNEGGRLRDVSKGAGPAFGAATRARARGRRLRQRRPARRPGLEQRRGAAPASQHGRRGPSLARDHAAGHGVQPRCSRRDRLVGRRREAPPAQDRGRQLSLLARSAGDSRHRSRRRRSTGWRSRGRAPSGRVERITNLPIDRYVRCRGEGECSVGRTRFRSAEAPGATAPTPV